MATKTKKANPAIRETNIAEKISDAYMDFILTKGKRPASVFEFTKKLKIEEQEFYSHFGSFDGLEKSIWADFIKTTLDTLSASEEYNSYPVKSEFFTPFFNKLAGSGKLRQQLEAGLSEDEIKASWQEDLIKFQKIRHKYLLYHDF